MQTPPRLAEALLRMVLSREDAEVISGDLDETFRTTVVPRAGPRAARFWYWRQTLSIISAHALGPLRTLRTCTRRGRPWPPSAGSFVRAPVARQAAWIHGNGGADARHRNRSECRDLLARQRCAAQAAALCGSRPADDGAPALAGSRGRASWARNGPIRVPSVTGASTRLRVPRPCLDGPAGI